MKNIGNYLIATAFAVAMAGTTHAADYTLKLAHNGPEQHPFQDGAEALKAAVEKSTGGAVKVQIFPGEQLGTEEAASQMVKQGTIGCTIASAGGGLAPFVPEADLLNLPFVFNDMDHFYRVVDGPVGERIAGKVEASLNAEVLADELSDSEATAMLDTITGEIRRLEVITGRYLHLSRKRVPQMARTIPKELVERLVDVERAAMSAAKTTAIDDH